MPAVLLLSYCATSRFDVSVTSRSLAGGFVAGRVRSDLIEIAAIFFRRAADLKRSLQCTFDDGRRGHT